MHDFVGIGIECIVTLCTTSVTKSRYKYLVETKIVDLLYCIQGLVSIMLFKYPFPSGLKFFWIYNYIFQKLCSAILSPVNVVQQQLLFIKVITFNIYIKGNSTIIFDVKDA